MGTRRLVSVEGISGHCCRCPGCKDRSSSSLPEERSNGGSCHGGNVDGREAGHDEGRLNVMWILEQTNNDKQQCFSAAIWESGGASEDGRGWTEDRTEQSGTRSPSAPRGVFL